MRTITIKPGEEIKIVCEGAGNNKNAMVEEEEVEITSEMNNAMGGRRKTMKSSKGRKSARKTTQSGGKKRKQNGYMKFAAEMRPKILKENPELRSNVVSVARKIGEAWRRLPEAERKKY